MSEGYYPHTLRIDARGRVWFTIAGSNHVARFDRWRALRHDPAPGASFQQDLVLRLLPFFMWLAQYVDLRSSPARRREHAVPYGIDIARTATSGSASSTPQDRRIDPETLEVEMVDTPFTRRGGCASTRRPALDSGLLVGRRLALRSGDARLRELEIPIEPKGT